MPTCRDHRVRGALNTCPMRTERALTKDRQEGARRFAVRRARGSCTLSQAPSMLSPGTSCTVHSLKARPELNGRRGVVVSQLDEGGRVGVQVEGEAKPLSLKPTNLEVVSAPPASSRAGADSAASSVDSKTLARFVTAHSIRASDAAKRQFAEEMRSGVALGGSWCCSSSTLWCVTCAANLAYSGLEDEISDNIPKLLGLAPCTTFRGERITPTLTLILTPTLPLTLTVTLTPTPAPAPNPNHYPYSSPLPYP